MGSRAHFPQGHHLDRMRGRGVGPTTSAGLVDGQYWLPPYIYPPAEFQPIDVIGYIAIPAKTTTAIVVQFQVPSGNNGIITGIANNFVGGGWSEGSGDVTWEISRDDAAVDGYDNILASLGSPANPVRHPSGFRIFESQVIKLTVTNANVTVAGQLSGGRLMGWYYPKEYENPSLQPM